MRKVVLIASCSYLLLAPGAVDRGAAAAADLDWRSDRSMKDEPVIVPRYPFSWTGFYIGGNLGYGWGSSSTIGQAGAPFNGNDGFTVNPSGWLGGLQAGYNWQIDNLVFGLEGDLGSIGADDSQSSATAFTKAEYGTYGTLTARLGFVDERWLFYLKGGAAFANIENTAGAIAGGVVDPTDLTRSDETRGGWTIGSGAEFAFQPNWSMKIEYLYMDFGGDTSRNADGDTFRHENDIHTIKVGVNYRFQRFEPPLR
jgi:outer membrane immunogenic protein